MAEKIAVLKMITEGKTTRTQSVSGAAAGLSPDSKLSISGS